MFKVTQKLDPYNGALELLAGMRADESQGMPDVCMAVWTPPGRWEQKLGNFPKHVG